MKLDVYLVSTVFGAFTMWLALYFAEIAKPLILASPGEFQSIYLMLSIPALFGCGVWFFLTGIGFRKH